jgi:hypothetical protein
MMYKDFCRMTIGEGAARRPALAEVARKYGRSAKNVYAIVERFKKSDA